MSSLKTHLDTVDMGFDVASFVQIQNMKWAEEVTALGKRYRTDTVQHLLTCWPPLPTLSLSVAVNCLYEEAQGKRESALWSVQNMTNKWPHMYLLMQCNVYLGVSILPS